MKLHSMIMVTLTKLLVIKIVASVRSLSVQRRSMFWSFALCSGSSSAMSVGERLKNAISEPLAKPDSNNNTAANSMHKMTPIEGD